MKAYYAGTSCLFISIIQGYDSDNFSFQRGTIFSSKNALVKEQQMFAIKAKFSQSDLIVN